MSTKETYAQSVEALREEEYPMLKDKTYLDHAGTTPYAKSLVDRISADLISNLYGNPHSDSSTSQRTGTVIDQTRERALRWFNADPKHFDLIFVANTTAAIKLVTECFRVGKDYVGLRRKKQGFWYGYHKDAHTSLVGVREASRSHKCFKSDNAVTDWIDGGCVTKGRRIALFGFPGQSNMTGRRLPLSWPGRIRRSARKANVYTLLDAAALATTTQLDLSDPHNAPDFITLSFYKIFGLPNLGALIVRKSASHMLLRRSYFGGGTVEMVISVNDTWHAMKDDSLHDRLEDGTLPFLSIVGLKHALEVYPLLFGGMKQVSAYTSDLVCRLHDRLTTLLHFNGQPVCRVYNDGSAVYGDPHTQGATVVFNIQRADGSFVGYQDVEKAADERGIYVRSGSLCNPGGFATHLAWSPKEMKAAYAAGHRCSRPTQVIMGKPTGVVRVSLGAMSIRADVDKFLDFVVATYVERAPVRIIPQCPTILYEFPPEKKPQTGKIALRLTECKSTPWFWR